MAYSNNKRAAKKKEYKKRLLVSFFVLCLILLGVFVFTMRLSAFQISTITINETEYVEKGELIEFVNNELLGTKFIAIPKSNVLFLDKKNIQERVISVFTEVDKVNLDRRGLNEIHVDIEEKVYTHVLSSQKTPYSLDPTGGVFRVGYEEISTGLRFSSNKEYKVGDQFLSEQEIKELEILSDSLILKGLVIKEIQEYSDFTLALITKQNTRILIPRTTSYDDIYSTFVKLLTTQEFSLNKEARDFKSDYAYINMQFGNKIFSCLVGDECEGNYR